MLVAVKQEALPAGSTGITAIKKLSNRGLFPRLYSLVLTLG